jgi:hypothetical protein
MTKATRIFSTPPTDSSLSGRHAIAGLALLPAAAALPTVAAACGGGLHPDHPEYDADDEIAAATCDALLDHADELVSAEPATLAGAVALMRYLAELKEWQTPRGGPWEAEGDDIGWEGWQQVLLATLADAIDKLTRVA